MFFRSNEAKSGLRSRCKQCSRKHKHRDKARDSATSKKYYLKNKEEILAKNKVFRAKNNDGEIARRKSFVGAKKGLIQKAPCIICGEEKVDGHHEDYSRPLDLVWLCRSHHRQLHAGHSIEKMKKEEDDKRSNKPSY